MKRMLALLCVLAALCACTLVAAADEPLNLSRYRVNDYTDTLTDEEVAEIDGKLVDFALQNHVDLVAAFLDESPDDYTDLADYADFFYNHNAFGYGDGKDGILMVVDFSAGRMQISYYGDFGIYAADAAKDRVSEAMLTALNQDGVSTATMQALIDAAQRCVDDPSGTRYTAEEMPSWYPTDISSFVRTHNDPSDPRVVDDADIFTPEQEAAMAAKIAAITEETGYDLVVFTDTSSYGIPRSIFAADFYFFRGYGLDEDYSGAVLFICMDPHNRGWWSAATGKCEALFTEEMVNRLDDWLEPHMIAGRESGNANGEFGDGVLNYLDNVATLYRTGKVPKQYHFKTPAVIAIIVGAIAGLIVMLRERAKMKTVEKASMAHEYVVPGSFRRRELADMLVNVVVTKTAKPKNNGGGGGGSSYSGGYSSSGGGSFSGGGRSF